MRKYVPFFLWITFAIFPVATHAANIWKPNCPDTVPQIDAHCDGSNFVFESAGDGSFEANSTPLSPHIVYYVSFTYVNNATSGSLLNGGVGVGIGGGSWAYQSPLRGSGKIVDAAVTAGTRSYPFSIDSFGNFWGVISNVCIADMPGACAAPAPAQFALVSAGVQSRALSDIAGGTEKSADSLIPFLALAVSIPLAFAATIQIIAFFPKK